MNGLQANATMMLESATSLERSGSLKDAHKCYVDAVNILKSIWSLEGTGMSGEARERFILYLRQVDAKAAQLKQRLPPEVAPASIAVLRPANSLLDTAGALSSTSPPPAAAAKVSTATSPTTATPPVPTQAPKVGGTPKHQDPVKAPPSKNDDLLPSLPDFPRNLPPPAKVTVAKAPPAKAATPTTEKPDPAPVSTVPPPAPPSSVAPVSAASSFAPRTSNVVMHAIELSIKLSKERKYKQAIDVLQHAYDAGRGEGNNPANFSKIQEMVVELRKRYYEVFKPRFFQDNAVTKDEMEILRKSGQTTTILLPIWDDVSEGYAAENVYLPCKGENWEDAFAPFISPKQKSSGCVLARYPKIVSAPETLKVYYEADPMNIKQTVVGDCSLVSSLIICTNFQKRFPQYNLISGVVFPQDENGAPMVSPKGKYCVKMLVNGITRMVVVDDRIPVSKTMKTPPPPSPTSPTPPTTLPSTPITAAAGGGSGEVTAAQAAAACRFLFQPLCTYSRNPAEMWVSIIEKAFVKVCGGSYDFPGSNSSVDMFKLSGWLPDGYYFDGEGVDLELQWKRLSVSHGRGAVLTTISTPQNLTKDVEEKLKLVPGHAYAVIGVLEEDGRRLLKIKNPWARQSWEGLYSFRDTNWPPELKEKLGFHEIEANQGVFWMSWADVCRYFKRCNLSWNPYLLFQPIADNTPKKPRRLAAHGVLTWTDCFAECPQYHVMARQLSKPTRLHVVLARHVLNLVKEYEQRSDAVDDDSPLITVHVFDVTNSPTVAQLSAGRQGTYLPNCEGNSCMARLISNGGELLGGDDVCRIHQGVYKNIEAQTISFTCPAGDRDLVLVVAQHQGKKESKFPFSLFLHTEISAIGGGNSPSLTMHLIPAFKPCGEDNKSGNSLRSVTQGAWKAGQSCGGKSDAQTFVFNPQYELTLTAPSHLTIRLNAGENKEAINVQVVRRRQGTSSGGRATSSPEVPWAHRVDCIHPRNCDIVLQSPMFFHSGAILDTALQACLAFDATNTLKPQAPAPPPPIPASPTAPPPPPPQRWVGPVVVNLPKSSTTKTFEIPCVFDSLPAASLILVSALAQSMLVSPDLSKVIHSGNILSYSDPAALVKTFAVAASPFVLLANTEDLQRTQPLQSVVVELYEVARTLMKVQHTAAVVPYDDPIPPAVQKEALHVNEIITQLLGKLDAVPCPSDDVRAARRAVVVACHEVHKVCDALLVGLAAPPAASQSTTRGGSTAGSPTGSTASSPNTPAPVVPVAPLNPLPAGTYTVVVSAWKKSSPSPFTLWVETTSPHSMREIPTEGTGYRPVVIQTQLRGMAPPPADVLTVAAAGSRQVMLPVSHPLFLSQACLTITTGKVPCVLTARVMTVEANPQQGPSTVSIAAAVFSITGSSDSTATRVAQLMFVSPFCNHSVAIDPMSLLPQHQYIVMLLSAEVSSLPLVVRCYGSTEFSAKVNN